ncbi:hypothetical protein EV361DRAFT_876176 [Lentinula raphanica]|uniref:Uncharacterized protein n=1 Tax=Lentinula raphanica TaxID=153919 RepID=A0AA38NYB9_9AGAR|nr:hypothetical protein C8R42DRAFT_710473 [Lentinula raphanica]KAJ3769763.1 hypothetical protein FB446DRAFT_774131 [Lentinula raphanica]KAJ3827106.1 hypothetical protein F5880DRAFT_1540098 [Lentinula raphanica]KAJ3832856.1 hypothetical protein F5878DRAFT_634045 [Lentinula raphanica]KAJ3977957.1 hypothetical protein EV361DRAFT_876176 [Lentinula raphanica]
MYASYPAERSSIPQLRHQVLYVAVAEFLFSIIFLVIGFLLLYTLGENILDADAVALNLHIFAYFFLGLSTTLGISGALYSSRALIAMFCSMVMAQLVFGLGSGIYCLTILFNDPGSIMSRVLHTKCLNLDHFSRAFCERTPMMKYLTLALFLQMWLIEIVGIYYAQGYVQELLDEETDGVKEIDYEYEYDYAYYG